MSVSTKRDKVYRLTKKMRVFNLDLSSLIFLKSGRETEAERGVDGRGERGAAGKDN